MTLYYEDVPADDSDVPQLPPLLTAAAVPSGQNVHHKAIALPHHRKLGPYSIRKQWIECISLWFWVRK